MQSEQPIGIFDSGVGGLSIARGIRGLLPAEDVLYIADSRHAPYGDKPHDFILSRSMALTAYLVEQGAKAVVVACNTVTLATIRALRERFEVPIVGVEPGVKPAVLASRSGVIGVLATASTVASPGIRSLIGRFSAGKR
ncbi:glutamate racemase, partial [Arhodomonas sp. KWT]